jgi:hypothetical protein
MTAAAPAQRPTSKACVPWLIAPLHIHLHIRAQVGLAAAAEDGQHQQQGLLAVPITPRIARIYIYT